MENLYHNVQPVHAATVCYAGVASATQGTAAVPTGDWLYFTATEFSAESIALENVTQRINDRLDALGAGPDRT